MIFLPERYQRTWKAAFVGLLCSLGLGPLPACARERALPAPEPLVAKQVPAREKSPPVLLKKPAASRPAAQARSEGARPSVKAPQSQPAERSPTSATADSAEDAVAAHGRQLFGKYCIVCHGEKGDGAGKFAYLMNPRPRNFQQEPFKLYTTQNQIPADDDLIRTISRGMPGSAMPPWGHLPRADLQALVRFVRQIKREAVSADVEQMVVKGDVAQDKALQEVADRCDAGPAIVVPAEPVFDELRWFRGRKLYLDSCAACHGTDGKPVASAIKFDDQGFPVPPRSFVDGIFKGGSEGYQLYARIMKGLRGTPMPSNEDSVKGDEAWDLIHYVQSLARAGAQERAQLRMGTIVAPAVQGKLPDGPRAPEWDQSRPVYVALTPLWWIEDRIEGLVVQAMHNEKEVAFRLSWLDATEDTRAVQQNEFRDGVAIQFSLSPDPPFYMGSTGLHGGVNIWYWKADRQKDLEAGRQDVADAYPNKVVDLYQRYDARPMEGSATQGNDPATLQTYFTYLTSWASGNLVATPTLKTAVECLVARGPGTLSGKPPNMQLIDGKAVFERGVWYVQMQRSLELPDEHKNSEADERIFKPGDYLPVSFAVWNGSAGDRDGKKNISIWQKLVIE